jgi:type IV pilus assembly protein PilC
MPLFTYKAIRKGESEPYENTVEAKDRFEIYAIVRKEDAQVLSVKEGSAHKAMFENLLSGLSRVSEGDKIILMRNLGSMITAGLALSRALNVMERQTKNAKLKEVLQSIGQDIQQGNALNVAMTKHPKVFTPLMIAMVKSGEESGSLAESCQIIADQNERVYELKKKVRGAMIYPSVILFVLLSIGTLMMLYIVPTLSKTFEDMGSELPLSTQVIIKLSNFLVDYTALTLLACVGIVAVFITFIRTSFGKHAFESVVLRIPVIGTLVKETNSARTGRTPFLTTF